MSDILDDRWLTNKGPYVQAFEQKIARMLDVKHCIAMCNGTIGLEIAIRATGLSGEVIIPSFTFVATAHALQWQEITPVFCDIDPQTHHLDPDCVERLITPRTTGIIGVHVWGRGCAVDRLTEIAARHNLKLLFDAAHAFGCSENGRMLGSFGNAEIFSFHATKFLNTFEGGAITTNDDELAARIRYMKNFGFAGYDDVRYLGINGKMSEIAAAMGLTGLESLEEFININYRNYQQYKSELQNIPGLQLITYPETEKSNYQYIVVEVDETVTGISRDWLVTILHAENILARRYFYPGCHQMEPYRSEFPNVWRTLPETEKLTRRVLILPTGQVIHPQHIKTISEIILFVTQNTVEIRNQLEKQAHSHLKESV